MRDGIEEPAEAPAPSLSYPFRDGPDFGDAIEIAPGVRWLRMPLPFRLQFINVWAIEDGDGWAIVDTGLGDAATLDTWRQAFAGPLGGRPASRVFVTHMHADHSGMADWLTDEFGCRLWMSRLEYLNCRSVSLDSGRQAPAEGLDFYHAAGWDSAGLARYRAQFGSHAKAMYSLPDSFQRLSDGDLIRIGAEEWEVVVGSGHTPEHACLYSRDLKLMISGDQVLPRISTNVSVSPSEPEANPLHDWLTSLARIRTRVPDDVLVLPAHNDPFHGLHTRIDQLIEGHRKGLQRLRELLVEPARVVDVFPALFRARIDDSLRGMATGESLSHLNYLLARGEVTRTCDADGVAWYRSV